ncbi:MAG: type II toxin-antitoxin system VapC family toxin [Planctomycetota bacterium]
MRVVIDTNVLVSGADPKDAFHSECRPILEKLLRSEVEAVCPVLVLVEAVCVLRRRTDDEHIALRFGRSLALLPSINWLSITVEDAQRACALGVKSGLRGGDAIVLQAAKEWGIPLLTQDREIKKKAPKDIVVLAPSDFVV